MIGIGAALGGAAAVKWISERVDEVMNYRQVAGPTPVWDIVSFDRDSVRRRQDLEDQPRASHSFRRRRICTLSLSPLGPGRPDTCLFCISRGAPKCTRGDLRFFSVV